MKWSNFQVIARIFFVVNRSWSGRITIPELRRSNFLATLRILDQVSILPNFYEGFFCQYSATKNYKAEIFGFVISFQLCNFLAPQFHMKNARVKCWWNWQVLILPTFYEQPFFYKIVMRRFYVYTVCFCNFLSKGNWHKSSLKEVVKFDYG